MLKVVPVLRTCFVHKNKRFIKKTISYFTSKTLFICEILKIVCVFLFVSVFLIEKVMGTKSKCYDIIKCIKMKHTFYWISSKSKIYETLRLGQIQKQNFNANIMQNRW